MKTKLFLYLILFNWVTTICYAQSSTIKLLTKGRDTTETKIIDSIAHNTKFQNFTELNNELLFIQESLLKKGYLDLIIKNPESTTDSTFTTSFSLNTKYKKIKIRYNNTEIPKNLLLQTKATNISNTWFTLPINKVEETLQQLTSYLVNQGNTFTNLQLTKIQKKGNIIVSKLISTKSTKRTIDNIVIKGYTKFPQAYLKHFARLRTGKIFTKQKLLKKAKNIENLSFANNSKAPEILFDKDSTSVYLYLEKQSANNFDGFLGFSSNTESNKLELNGYIDLNLTNNLNFGESLHIIYKNDGDEQQRFRGNISLPYILKSPIGITAQIDIFKKDSSFLVTQQKLNLNYLINSRDNLFIGYQTTASNNLLETPQPLLKIEDYNSSFLNIGFNHSKLQNNVLFPTKNNFILHTEIGSRKTKLNKTNQFRAQTSFSRTIELNRRNSIFIKNTAAIILSDIIFTNELYRFGGINSIRGFEENSINGSLYNIINSEYRYILSPSLYMKTIIDYAYFEDESNNYSDSLTSFGLGLGLNTETGLFKIIFANGKNSTQNFQFSNTKVHISLTASF